VNRCCSSRSGITLIDMIMVLAIVGLISAIAFPTVTTGLDTVRLSSASDSIVSFLNSALNRAQRRQTPIEIYISIPENKIKLLASDLTRELSMPETIRIAKLHPEILTPDDNQTRSIVLYPGGAIPRFGIEIEGPRKARRIVRVDPITGVPEVEVLE
jgi:type II secretory pathway pseudopilin PulG